MPTYYTYFISSLPMLHFGMKPPFSYGRFIAMCKGLILDEDITLIKALPELEIDRINPSTTLRIDGERPFNSFHSLRVVPSGAEGRSRTIKDISNQTVRKWFMFDTGLRNELVRQRAVRLHKDPNQYLRMDGYADLSITHIALSAYRNPAILEAEKILDYARWSALEELAMGHYFDSDALFIYALKLLIVERWEKIKEADKPKLFEEVIQESR